MKMLLSLGKHSRGSKYMKQKLIELQGAITIVGDVNSIRNGWIQ